MFLKKCVLVIFAVALSAQTSYSQRQSCSTAESNKADREAGRLRTWDALYRSYNRFAHCDDGSIAEGYSDSVGRILVEQWETLPRLVILANNGGFHKFVLRHVDATLDTRELEKIRTNAVHRCPAGKEDLCEQLVRAADEALKANGVVVRGR